MSIAIECREMAVPVRKCIHSVTGALPAFSEVCWFLLSLLLFMALGPFAAPIAVFALFSLDSEHRGLTEPDKVG